MANARPNRVFQTGAAPVAAGQSGGWVSGTPANLIDGATVDVVFDLGPDWAMYTLVQLVYVSTAATSLDPVRPTFADTPVFNAARAPKDVATPGLGAASYQVTSAGGPQSSMHRIMGRYCVVRMTNTAAGGVQGAGSSVALAMFDN